MMSNLFVFSLLFGLMLMLKMGDSFEEKGLSKTESFPTIVTGSMACSYSYRCLEVEVIGVFAFSFLSRGVCWIPIIPLLLKVSFGCVYSTWICLARSGVFSLWIKNVWPRSMDGVMEDCAQ